MASEPNMGCFGPSTVWVALQHEHVVQAHDSVYTSPSQVSTPSAALEKFTEEASMGPGCIAVQRAGNGAA